MNTSPMMRAMVLLFTAALVACGGTRTEPVILTNATVELDAFSGRPNPTWQMTQAETRDVEARLRDLPSTTEQLPESTLGYRGFYIRNGDGQRVYVTHGLVAFMEDEQRSRVFRDANDIE